MRCNMWKFFAFLFIVFMGVKGITVEAETIDRWDLTKEYTLEEGGVRYHAYLSKDRKESWIYKAELLDKQKVLDVVFPKTMQGVPVTCLGISYDLYDKIDKSMNEWGYYYNLFYQGFEPHYDYGKQPLPLAANVRSVVLPDTVEEMGAAAFACMSNLQYVHLPKKITTIGNYMFYGCRKLQKVDFPPKMVIPSNSTAFQFCEGLKGLMEEVAFRREGVTIISQGDLLINQQEKTLIQVMPKAKKIIIPANVKKIEPLAFTNSSLQKVKVAKKNKYFAVHKRCLYNRKTGKLILLFGKGKTVNLSQKVKKIGKDAKITKYKIKKLVISNKIKRTSGWKRKFIANNKKIKIYYRGKRIR